MLILICLFLYKARTKRMEDVKIKKMREEKKKAKVFTTIIFLSSTSLKLLFLIFFLKFCYGCSLRKNQKISRGSFNLLGQQVSRLHSLHLSLQQRPKSLVGEGR